MTPQPPPTDSELADAEDLLRPLIAHGSEHESPPTIQDIALRLRELRAEWESRLRERPSS
jgi:hypothetical protein